MSRDEHPFNDPKFKETNESVINVAKSQSTSPKGVEKSKTKKLKITRGRGKPVI